MEYTVPQRTMRTIQSLDKGLRILELICAKRKIRLKEAATLVSMTSSNTALFLNSLIMAGLVEKKNGFYEITDKVGQLAPDTRARFRSLVSVAAEGPMMRLHGLLNENVLLAVREGMKTHYLLRFQSDHLVQIVQQDVVDYPIHVSAHGKVILAYEQEAEIDDYIRTCAWERYTEHTIVTPDDLRDELALIRERSYAVNNGEYEANVMALAAPISYDGIVSASLVVQFPTLRHSIRDVMSHHDVIVQTADEINASIARYRSQGEQQ